MDIASVSSLDSSSVIAIVLSKSGLSQAELARRSGLSRSVINAYLHGTRQPGTDALLHIARSANLEVSLKSQKDIVDPIRAGRILEQVLDLAEALPFERSDKLEFPGLPRISVERSSAS